jgi:hypothetical protein
MALTKMSARKKGMVACAAIWAIFLLSVALEFRYPRTHTIWFGAVMLLVLILSVNLVIETFGVHDEAGADRESSKSVLRRLSRFYYDEYDEPQDVKKGGAYAGTSFAPAQP